MSSSNLRSRVQKGVPTGGQFAVGARTDSGDLAQAPGPMEFTHDYPTLVLEGAARVHELADELRDRGVKQPYVEASRRVYFGEERWSDRRLVPNKAERDRLFREDFKKADRDLQRHGFQANWRAALSHFPDDAGGSELLGFSTVKGQRWLQRGSRLGTYRIADDRGRILPMEAGVGELLEALDRAKS